MGPQHRHFRCTGHRPTSERYALCDVIESFLMELQVHDSEDDNDSESQDQRLQEEGGLVMQTPNTESASRGELRSLRHKVSMSSSCCYILQIIFRSHSIVPRTLALRLPVDKDVASLSCACSMELWANTF